MKIAMLGTRGIPGGYSGFETAVEHLSTRLAARGHEVVVYCRPHMVTYEGDEYKGVRLIKISTIANKYLDTIVHTAKCTAHLLARERCDVALYFIAGNSPFCFFPRLFGIPTAINVDGLDSQRDKWNRYAKIYLRFAERLATRSANELISDSMVIKRYYQERFGADSTFIPYGASMEPVPGTKWLDEFGLKPREYILFVGRLVPENCPDVLLEAYRGLDTDKKLVIVGDAPYAEDYIARLKAMGGENVVFTGYLFDDGYRQLSQNAFTFVVPTIVGGTHPVIVEALAAGNCVVVSDHEPNLETIGDAGVSYARSGGATALRETLAMLLADPQEADSYRGLAVAWAREHYDWDVITEQYEQLCALLSQKQGRIRSRSG